MSLNKNRYETYCQGILNGQIHLKMVTKKVAEYSKEKFGKPLCWYCQRVQETEIKIK